MHKFFLKKKQVGIICRSGRRRTWARDVAEVQDEPVEEAAHAQLQARSAGARLVPV
jgi:hypothetical protein